MSFKKIQPKPTNSTTTNFIDKLNTVRLCQDLDQYKNHHLYFCEPIKNSIINDGNFIRILYSTPLFILNGIYLCFSLKILSVEKYYNKLKCNFYIPDYFTVIEKCKRIEEDILEKANIHKVAQYKVYEQMKNGNIKIFNTETNPEENKNKNKNEITINETNHFVLKISGIWESELHYGLTFKISCR